MDSDSDAFAGLDLGSMFKQFKDECPGLHGWVKEQIDQMKEEKQAFKAKWMEDEFEKGEAAERSPAGY